MTRLVADYDRMARLADELLRFISRLELGDSHYLRKSMRTEVTGSLDVTDACGDFEDEWSFGRDRISNSLQKLAGFLMSASKEYEETDTQLAIGLLTAGKSPQSRIQNTSSWWNSLTPEEQDEYVRLRPTVIGNLDGIPPDVRYRANAIAIREHIAYLETTNASSAEIEKFQLYLGPDPLLDKKIADLRRSGADPETIARLEDLREAQRNGDPPRQILVFDPSGDGRIAEVHGSLTTADNVVVFVPGISNNLSDFSGRSNSQAQDLYGAGRADTAVISWMGYDTPANFGDPATYLPDRAISEAAQLASFTEGLSATIPGSITVAAHSYGAVLATHAAKAGMNVDRVILIGDPGVPASNVSEYNGAQVFAVHNVGDIIPVPTVHGSNPTTSDFGATVLQGNVDFEDTIPLAAHTSYFKPESTAIGNIMAAAEGKSSH